VICLQVDPKFRGRAERSGQQPRGLRRHSTLASYQLVDALNRNTEVLGKGDLRQAERLEKLLIQYFTGMGRDSLSRQHHDSLVVVSNFDFVSISGVPPKDDAPLIVNLKTVLAVQVAFERLESVPRRSSQISEVCSRVEKIKFSRR